MKDAMLQTALRIAVPVIAAAFAMYYSLQFTEKRVECLEKRQCTMQDALDNYRTEIVSIKKDVEYIRIAIDELRGRR